MKARRTYAFTELFMFELRMLVKPFRKSSDEAVEEYNITLVVNTRTLTLELTDAKIVVYGLVI